MTTAILDRDGTLIDFVRDHGMGVVTPAFHPEQVRLLPGVVEGLHALQAAGFTLAIATNQPGAAKGEIPREAIERTNAALLDRLRSEGIAIATMRACLHHPEGGDGGTPDLVQICDCRKPAPGMLQSIMSELGAEPATTWMVGDTASDMAAAAAAGVSSALLMRRGRCELCIFGDGEPYGTAPTLIAGRFDEVAAAIVDF